MTAEALARALDGRRNGKGWRAKCPAHKDDDPSLDITEQNGKTLVICRAGCSQEAVLDALRKRGLWQNGHNPDELVHLVHPTLGRPHQTYEYFDAKARLIGAVCRWNMAKGKEIRPAIREDGRWHWKAFPNPKPLYHLPNLAAHPEKPVLVVEGEKAVEAARELVNGVVVTTWPGGTGAVRHVDLSPLKGRDVVLWPDNDDAGRKAMRAIADRLVDARSLKGVKLPEGLPKDWDLGDAIPADLDPVALIGRAVSIRAERLSNLKLVNAADLAAADFKPPNFAVPGVLCEGQGILAGRPKSGKSWLALDWGVAVADGGAAMGNIVCEPGDVLYLALEDTERRLHSRLKAVLQGAPAPARLSFATTWKRADEGGLDDIRAWLSANPGARLVIVDTLAKMRGRPDRDRGVYENDYAAVAGFKALADEFTVPILLIHHLRKEGGTDPLDTVSGTAGLTGSADNILVLKREPNDPFGFLYVRGRDVHETEMALQFNNDTGKWLNIGTAREFRMSEERKAVVAVLRENSEAMTPAAIARELGKSQGSIRMLLGKMRSAGEINRLANGKYWVSA